MGAYVTAAFLHDNIAIHSAGAWDAGFVIRSAA